VSSSKPWTVNQIHNLLDNTKKAVSSGAFERHGKIVETVEGYLQFDLVVTIVDEKKSQITEAETECSICENSTATEFRECVLRDPFVQDSSYVKAQKNSHREVECAKCKTIGEITCDVCNGNGRSNCGSCNASGQEEYREECPMCKDEPEHNPECAECGGDGEIVLLRECTSCHGKGHKVCSTCNGDGYVSCTRCRGTGKVHKYDQMEHEIAQKLTTSDLPPFWQGDNISFANKFRWRQSDLNILNNGTRNIKFETSSLDVEFISIMYGDEYFNAVLSTHHAVDHGVWDPETGFPRTSLRRKISDLKSRVLW
jgi:hypothetical protein